MDASEAGSGPYYVPELTSSPVILQLRLACIENLSFEMIKALKSVPRRGLEIGGILLGRLDAARSTIVIEDSEPVESEHLHGPSWLLSARDQSVFREAIGQFRNRSSDQLRPVGFYRSQTRDGLDFDDQDNAVAREMFGNEPSVCLLVKPSIREPSEARIGIKAGDLLLPLTTFPFHVGALREGAFHIVATATRAGQGQENAAEPIEPGEGTGGGHPIPFAAISRSHADTKMGKAGLRGLQVTAALLFVAALVLLGMFLTSKINARSEAGTAQPAAGLRPVAEDGIRLNVQRQNGSAILSWNHESPAVQKANYGLLTIEDGGRRRELRLSRDELENGRVVYSPGGPDISFQMKLFAPAQTTTESIRSYAEFSEAPTTTRKVSPSTQLKPRVNSRARGEARVRAVPPEPESSTENTRSIPPQTAPATPGPVVAAAGQATEEPIPFDTANEPRLSETVPVPKPDLRPGNSARERLITTVSVEPAGRTGLKSILKDLSPRHVLRLHSADNKFIPSRALRQTRPELPSHLISEIHGEKQIKVKVTIGAEGEVVKTELVSGRSDDEIASAVLYAARNWTFEPARMDSRAVESKAILHFVLRARPAE